MQAVDKDSIPLSGHTYLQLACLPLNNQRNNVKKKPTSLLDVTLRKVLYETTFLL